MRTDRKRVAVAFTLVELLVALLIVITLAVVTVPAIAPMLQVNRVQSAAHALKAALVHARSVALARHQNAICWIANGTVVESGTLAYMAGAEEMIVDNLDAEFSSTGTWAESGMGDEWEGSSFYCWPHSGGTATWTPALTVAATYEVYAWWANHNETSNRDSDAEYTVTYAEGAQDTIAVDQDDDGGQWNLLGTYAFDASGTENVTLLSDLSDPADRPTSADAIRMTGVLPPADETKAIWHFTVTTPAGASDGDPATVRVEGKWPANAGECISDATFTVTYEGGSQQFVIDQQTTAGDWYNFGDFSFLYGSTYTVELTNATSNYGSPGAGNIYVYADAIKVTDQNPPGAGDILPDAGEFAVLTDGWTVSTAYDTGYLSGPYLWANVNVGDPRKAVWVFTAPDGNHTIYGWWPYRPNYSSVTPFTVYRRTGAYPNDPVVATATVSQQEGGEWRPIVSCTFTGGQEYYIMISSDAASGTYVIADAIGIPGEGESSFATIPCFGYLYLGHRAGLPVGATPPAETPRYLSYTQEGPSDTPIVADWISDNPDFSPHGEYGYVLTLAGSVRRVALDEATHRWTSPENVCFYW